MSVYDKLIPISVPEEQKVHFEFAQNVYLLSEEVRRQLSKARVENSKFVFAFGSLYMDSCGKFLSTIELCQIGHAHDGFLVGRSMLENFIYMKYILTNREQLSEQFIDYGYFVWLRYKESGKKVSFMQERDEELDRSIENWKAEFAEQLRPFLTDRKKWNKNWTGKSLESLVNDKSIWGDEEAIRDIYNTRYRHFSMYSHPTFPGVARLIRSDLRGFNSYKSLENVDSCLVLVGGLFLEISRLISDVFDLDLQLRFEELGQQFAEIKLKPTNWLTRR